MKEDTINAFDRALAQLSNALIALANQGDTIPPELTEAVCAIQDLRSQLEEEL